LAADVLEEIEDRLIQRRVDNEYELRETLQKLDICERQNYEVKQILGKALGFPLDKIGGSETPKTLAIMAAKKIEELEEHKMTLADFRGSVAISKQQSHP
jgi:hypothetical protein